MKSVTDHVDVSLAGHYMQIVDMRALKHRVKQYLFAIVCSTFATKVNVRRMAPVGFSDTKLRLCKIHSISTYPSRLV